MRLARTLLLIAALALCAAQTIAQTSQSAPAPGPYSAEGLYNLANGYARAGKAGLAVLNYERAALLAPDDPDIVANLDHVRAVAHVPVEPQGWPARLVESTPPDWAAWLGVAGIVLVGMALVLMRATSRFHWICRGAIACGLVQISLAASNALLVWPRMHEAIILVDQTAAHAAPASMADTEFVLREAQSVRMVAEHQDFVLVRTAGGLSGWVARANLGAIVPPTL